MTKSIEYRTCRSCREVIQKPVTLIRKFPELFKLAEPQPDPYRWATADAAESTSCGTGGQFTVHAPATPVECVIDDTGQCVNYVADHASAPNLHACPAGEGRGPGDVPGAAHGRRTGGPALAPADSRGTRRGYGRSAVHAVPSAWPPHWRPLG